MNKQAYISLIATASTPTTTNTRTAVQQTSSTSLGLSSWLLVEVPLLSALGFGTIVGALITSIFQWKINSKNREHAEKIERIRNISTQDLDQVKAEHNQQLEKGRQEHEQSLEEMRQSYERKKLRDENRWELIQYWKKFLDTRSDVLYLADDSLFQALDQSLPLSARQELSHFRSEYERRWKQFLENDLIKVEQDARFYAANLKVIEAVTFSASDRAEAERFMRSQYRSSAVDEAREELGKPLRNFLYKQLAELQKNWELI
jgi:hypothetical protein